MGGSPLYLFSQYLKYRFRAKGAHALHSPFLFDLYNQVIRKSKGFKISEIESLRKELLTDYQLIDVLDFKNGVSKRKTISSVAKSSTSSRKFSAFLHLLVEHLEVQNVLETGTSLGINTLYLAKSNAAKVVTIEGSNIISQIANKGFQKLSCQNIQLLQGELKQIFPKAIIQYEPGLVFLDADHRGKVTTQLIDAIIKQLPGIKCIVVHDIYWSKDMTKMWHSAIQKERISLTVDIFQAGLIFPNLDMKKQHFTLRF